MPYWSIVLVLLVGIATTLGIGVGPEVILVAAFVALFGLASLARTRRTV